MEHLLKSINDGSKMIIIVTDMCGSTNIAEQNKSKPNFIYNFYSKAFHKQLAFICGQNFDWKIIKSTGDGLLITSTMKENNPNDLIEFINLIHELFIKFKDDNDCLPPIRVMAHHCILDSQNIVTDVELKVLENTITINNYALFSNTLRTDIFGPQVNLLFRLSQTIIGSHFIISDDLVKILVEKSDLFEHFLKKKAFSLGNLLFGPAVPLTHFKGIDSVGFTDSEKNRKPFWVWEVN